MTGSDTPKGYFSHFDEDNANLYRLSGDEKSYFRVMIMRGDGSAFMIQNEDIHTIEIDPDGRKMGLCIRGGLIVTLEGDRLFTLADYLAECRVRKLYCFKPDVHKLRNPTDPVIHQIIESTPEFKRE